MGIEQHFMALGGICREPERATGTELGVGDQELTVDTADDQQFFAPVKSKCFAQLEFERNKGRFASNFSGLIAALMNKPGDAGIATGKTFLLDFGK